MNYKNLSALILEKYKTYAAFGLAMEWVPQKVNKLTNGYYVPKIGEAVTMSRVLGITLDELASFFI